MLFGLYEVYAASFLGPSWSKQVMRQYGSEPPAASASGTPMAEMSYL